MIILTGPTMVFIGLVTGVFLLLYGVRLVSDAVQQTIRGRMQEALPWLSKNPFAAFGIGVVATGLLQSSSAMSSLLVELVSADLLPLGMTIVILMGSNVGSTLVVQLLAFHVTDFALPMFGLGGMVALLTHRRPALRQFGLAIFGFSLVMLGLATIKAASDPIAASQATTDILRGLADAPIVLAIIGVALAMMLNSSAAAIGMMLPLAATGALSLPSALALMLGANVGTTLLSMLVALGAGSLAGRRLALVHFGTKLLGAAVLLFLLQPLSEVLSATGLDHATLVALTHLAFSLVMACLFIPLAGSIARLMELSVPEKVALPAGLHTQRLLDPQALATPAVAKGLATRETLRMGDLVTTMLELGMQAFEENPDAIQTRLEALDDELDELDAAIKNYLLQLDEEATTNILLTIIDDLEVIGDVINRHLMSLASRLSRHQVRFSEDGWQELRFYYQQITGALQQVLAALATHDPTLAIEFLARKRELKQLKQDLRLKHVGRLRAGHQRSIDSSAIHLDLLHAMSTIIARIANIAHVLQDLPVDHYLLSEGVPVNTYVLSEEPSTSSLAFKRELIPEVSVTADFPLFSTGQFVNVRGQAMFRRDRQDSLVSSFTG